MLGAPSRHVFKWLIALCTIAQSRAQEQLSPPWWVAYNAYNATAAGDPCLNLTDMHASEGGTYPQRYSFNVTLCAGCPASKAVALATFLSAVRDFGGTLLRAVVVDAAGAVVQPADPEAPRQAQALVAAALEGNTYFTGTHISSPLYVPMFWVEFRADVIQFWDDNLADYHGNSNYVAAELFSWVFRLEEFGLLATTQSRGGLEGISKDGGGGGGEDSASKQQQQQQRWGRQQDQLSRGARRAQLARPLARRAGMFSRRPKLLRDVGTANNA